jgi:hypothetical protein
MIVNDEMLIINFTEDTFYHDGKLAISYIKKKQSSELGDMIIHTLGSIELIDNNMLCSAGYIKLIDALVKQKREVRLQQGNGMNSRQSMDTGVCVVVRGSRRSN